MPWHLLSAMNVECAGNMVKGRPGAPFTELMLSVGEQTGQQVERAKMAFPRMDFIRSALSGNTGTNSLRQNYGVTSFAEAAGTRLNLEGVPGVRLEEADSEFIFKPKWALQLPGRSRRLSGRIEIGIWSDTCQEACRLPNGQGFRLAEGQACA
ncbi:unnamed protein product [Nyctereutes procyonoides]|uniref:(raccoon dog) hypothetical protein n=1 Tax=Nyctereutes procyonoides TaxID=34880 RepID=A0A811Y0E5_NYCPR|nr:unnamed protein product [Nyctereutes procyonoides]